MKKLTLKLGLLLASFSVANFAAATELLNLVATKAGMHRITYEELRDQGADLSGVEVRRIGLSVNGEPVAVFANGQDRDFGARSEFGPGGYIEFYAEGSDSQYSDEQIFTLHSLSNSEINEGRRKLIRTLRTELDLNAPVSSEYTHTLVRHDNHTYSFTSPIANDPWHFGQVIARRGFDPIEFFGRVIDLNTDPNQRFSYNFDLSDVVEGSSARFGGNSKQSRLETSALSKLGKMSEKERKEGERVGKNHALPQPHLLILIRRYQCKLRHPSA